MSGICLWYNQYMSDDIKSALERAGLLDNFLTLAPSHQKEYFKWIDEAKKSDTRMRRIEKMIEILRDKTKN